MILSQIVGAVLVAKNGEFCHPDKDDRQGYRVEFPPYRIDFPPFHFEEISYASKWFRLEPVTRCPGWGWLSDSQLKELAEQHRWNRPRVEHVYSGNQKGFEGNFCIFWDRYPILTGTTGWRCDVSTDQPWFRFVPVIYDGIFGWLSEEERSDLRQSDPHIAP